MAKKEKAQIVKVPSKPELIARLVLVMKDWHVCFGEDFITFSKRYVAFMAAASRPNSPESEWLERARIAAKEVLYNQVNTTD